VVFSPGRAHANSRQRSHAGGAATNDGLTDEAAEEEGATDGGGGESADADEGGLAGEEAATEGDGADDTDVGDADAEAGDGDAEGDETELTEEEIEAINSFVFNLESLAGVLAALGAAQLPSTEELPIVVTNSLSECPTVTLDEGLLIIDYGDGCEPVLYPGSTFSGTVTGEVLIPWAEGMSTDLTGDTYGFTLNDVHSDPVGNVNFLPDAGTATLILGTEGPGALTIEITFTEDTPTDGTVLVSLNGSPAVVLSLEDVELEDIETE